TTDNRPPASTLQPLLPFRRRPPPTSTLFPYTTLFRSRTALHWPFDGGQRSPAPSRRSRGHIRRDRSRLPRHDRGGTGLLDRGPRPLHARDRVGRVLPDSARSHDRGGADQVRLPLCDARGLGAPAT